MDPVAHTLVGATLAESGLKRRSPLATATLLLGANAPDIDIVSAFSGRDASLYFRRGHTHGLLAMVVLPLVLTAVMLGWDRWVRRRRDPEAEPARASALLLLAAVSVWSHPALDWLNTYGVRLLMPFDATWFYGDSLFIVDPWLWLSMAAPVVLAQSRSKLSIAAWIVLATAATGLVTATDLVPVAAKVAWALGVAGIVALRVARPGLQARRIAIACVALLSAYVAAMVIGSRLARSDVRTWLADHGIVAEEIAAGPQPANPFAREVIARAGDRYYFVERRYLGGPAFRFSRDPMPIGPRDGVVAAALAAPEVRGLRQWLRFPSVSVVESSEGYAVTIRDVRYADSPGGLGHAVVHLDRDLRSR